jgi:hypothetical protein
VQWIINQCPPPPLLSTKQAGTPSAKAKHKPVVGRIGIPRSVVARDVDDFVLLAPGRQIGLIVDDADFHHCGFP